jgi:fructosamine-3-kinase
MLTTHNSQIFLLLTYELLTNNFNPNNKVDLNSETHSVRLAFAMRAQEGGLKLGKQGGYHGQFCTWRRHWSRERYFTRTKQA